MKKIKLILIIEPNIKLYFELLYILKENSMQLYYQLYYIIKLNFLIDLIFNICLEIF